MADTHRHRIGANYPQLPINRPKAPVHSYNKDGAMRHVNDGDQPVYAPNSFSGPQADPRYAEDAVWPAAGEMVRSPYELHAEDDDTGQPATLWDKVLDGTDREHLVTNIVAHAGGDDLNDDMKDRVVAYWGAVKHELGRRVAQGLGRQAPAAAGNGAVTGSGAVTGARA
ncbi:MAG: catalase [Solirubrobacteraceae bacterium]